VFCGEFKTSSDHSDSQFIRTDACKITLLVWFCAYSVIVDVDSGGLPRYDNYLVPPFINRLPTSTANSIEYEKWL